MEFIKIGKKYLIKNSNGRIVTEKEKLQLENHELILKDIKSPCAKEITKKLSKNNKRLKEIEKETALPKGVDADDTIEETDTTI